MTETPFRPAWSQQFDTDVIRSISARGPIAQITKDWAWEGSTGQGVRVAVIDSGIEHDHPALGDCVKGGIVVEFDKDADNWVRIESEDAPVDVSGHGTACAGIIHAIAPEAALYSVRVLGSDMKGRAFQFAAGIEWATQNGMHVANLSLSTSRQEYFALFHSLADKAYFGNVVLVSAVNNLPVDSFPSLYASVVSVAAHQGKDPLTFYYNSSPPVEFGAPGIDIHVPWSDKQYLTTTGNSFAAPHIAGVVSLIRAKHPELTPFQIKTVLLACAANVQRIDAPA